MPFKSGFSDYRTVECRSGFYTHAFQLGTLASNVNKKKENKRSSTAAYNNNLFYLKNIRKLSFARFLGKKLFLIDLFLFCSEVNFIKVFSSENSKEMVFSRDIIFMQIVNFLPKLSISSKLILNILLK